MATWKYGAALIAAAFLAVQPCAAAGELQTFNSDERRSAAFGGLKISMPLGQSYRARPTARLQLTSTQHMRDSRTGEVRTFSPPGLEFGASAKGKPMLFAGGREATEMKTKMGIGGTGTTLLVVGGVVLVLLVVAAASSGSGFPDCEPVGGNDDHCID